MKNGQAESNMPFNFFKVGGIKTVVPDKNPSCLLSYTGIVCMHISINPFQPNGISYSNQLEQTISVLRVGVWYFHCYSNFNR